MDFPSYDSVRKKLSSDVERAMHAVSKESVAETKKVAVNTAKIAVNTAITNDELRKLNSTSQQIASATAALVAIQSQALDESNKQTVILDAQLQIAKINELEKTRQNQIKQAAFSVDQKMTEIVKISSVAARYFYLKDEQVQVNLVNLSSDSPNEIIDKQYVRDVLFKLSNEINAAKSLLTNEQIRDIDSYYPYLNELSEAENSKQALMDMLRKPKAPNLIIEILKHIALPNFFENKIINALTRLFYYAVAFFAWLISWQIFASFIVLSSATYWFAHKKVLGRYKKAVSEYEATELKIKSYEDDIDKLKLFFTRIKRDYALPQ